MTYPTCHRLKLLRKYQGIQVVSSAALHAHLNGRYQEFIKWNATGKRKQTKRYEIGFHPETVEAFLTP